MVGRKTRRQTRRKKSIFLRLALVAFALYVLVTLVGLQMEIKAGEEKLLTLQNLAAQLSAENDSMEGQLENPEDIQQENAYDSGYIHPGQEVYVETPK